MKLRQNFSIIIPLQGMESLQALPGSVRELALDTCASLDGAYYSITSILCNDCNYVMFSVILLFSIGWLFCL